MAELRKGRELIRDVILCIVHFPKLPFSPGQLVSVVWISCNSKRTPDPTWRLTNLYVNEQL